MEKIFTTTTAEKEAIFISSNKLLSHSNTSAVCGSEINICVRVRPLLFSEKEKAVGTKAICGSFKNLEYECVTIHDASSSANKARWSDTDSFNCGFVNIHKERLHMGAGTGEVVTSTFQVHRAFSATVDERSIFNLAVCPLLQTVTLNAEISTDTKNSVDLEYSSTNQPASKIGWNGNEESSHASLSIISADSIFHGKDYLSADTENDNRDFRVYMPSPLCDKMKNMQGTNSKNGHRTSSNETIKKLKSAWCICYGATASGKTYTSRHIYLQSAEYIFKFAERNKLILQLSMFEIRGDQCYDLMTSIDNEAEASASIKQQRSRTANNKSSTEKDIISNEANSANEKRDDSSSLQIMKRISNQDEDAVSSRNQENEKMENIDLQMQIENNYQHCCLFNEGDNCHKTTAPASRKIANNDYHNGAEIISNENANREFSGTIITTTTATTTTTNSTYHYCGINKEEKEKGTKEDVECDERSIYNEKDIHNNKDNNKNNLQTNSNNSNNNNNNSSSSSSSSSTRNNSYSNAKIFLREDEHGTIQIRGTKKMYVNNKADIDEGLRRFLSHRATNNTTTNEESSRSHAIIAFSLLCPVSTTAEEVAVPISPSSSSFSSSSSSSFTFSTGPKQVASDNKNDCVTPIMLGDDDNKKEQYDNECSNICNTKNDQINNSRKNLHGNNNNSSNNKTQEHQERMKVLGKFYIVDLAGSERSKETYFHSQQQLLETKAINYSLGCLKECIRLKILQLHAATTNQPRTTKPLKLQRKGNTKNIIQKNEVIDPQDKPILLGSRRSHKSSSSSSVTVTATPHIPYRNCKLTLLLREALEQITIPSANNSSELSGNKEIATNNTGNQSNNETIVEDTPLNTVAVKTTTTTTTTTTAKIATAARTPPPPVTAAAATTSDNSTMNPPLSNDDYKTNEENHINPAVLTMICHLNPLSSSLAHSMNTLEFATSIISESNAEVQNRNRRNFGGPIAWPAKKVQHFVQDLDQGKVAHLAEVFFMTGKVLSCEWLGDINRRVLAAGGTEEDAELIYNRFHALIRKHKKQQQQQEQQLYK